MSQVPTNHLEILGRVAMEEEEGEEEEEEESHQCPRRYPVPMQSNSGNTRLQFSIANIMGFDTGGEKAKKKEEEEEEEEEEEVELKRVVGEADNECNSSPCHSSSDMPQERSSLNSR